MGQLMQSFYIPPDATSATLQWKERIWNLHPEVRIGRFQVLLWQNGHAVARFEDASGSESRFLSHTWIDCSTNLLSHAGETLQLVVQADTFAAEATTNWYADVEGFSLSCKHSATPEFQIYVGSKIPLQDTDCVGITTNLNFSSVVLVPSSQYYWSVASFRDQVANYSTTNQFTTGRRVLPEIAVQSMTENSVFLGFASRTNRFYSIEQLDTLSGDSVWMPASGSSAGTGGFMELEVLRPWTGTAYWRLKVSPTEY